MTVCIAAVCCNRTQHEGKIILCADTQYGGALGKSDSGLKIRPALDGWQVLTAGSDEEISSTLPLFRRVFVDQKIKGGYIDETVIAGLGSDIIQRRKRQKAEQMISAKYAISYDEFRATGKQFLPEDKYRRALDVIERDLEAEFILAGFTTGFPVLLEMRADGHTPIKENFAVIGEGAYLAQSVLLHRQHDETDPFDRALYTVFEAKKYAERVQSVGKTTTVVVIDAKGAKALTRPGVDYLETRYEELGPKPLPKDWDFPELNWLTISTVDVVAPSA